MLHIYGWYGWDVQPNLISGCHWKRVKHYCLPDWELTYTSCFTIFIHFTFLYPVTTHWERVLVAQLPTQAKVVEARTLCTRTSSKGSDLENTYSLIAGQHNSSLSWNLGSTSTASWWWRLSRPLKDWRSPWHLWRSNLDRFDKKIGRQMVHGCLYTFQTGRNIHHWPDHWSQMFFWE